MSIIYLKVKIKSLAEEARIIRREERKARQSARWLLHHQQPSEAAYDLLFGLRHHRTWDVRNEQRSSLLAYGYLRDKHYLKLEPSRPLAKKAIPARVVDLVVKYGQEKDKKKVLAALQAWSV